MALTESLPRTEWFAPDVDPTIPGNYESSTTGADTGHIFTRRWDGQSWISSVTNTPTAVRMYWRGVQPGAAPFNLYSIGIRMYIDPNMAALAA